MKPPTFRTRRLVEFRDTDAAGIVHFSVFFQYMEQAEHEFLRARGLSVLAHDDVGLLGWPRVSASCDYRGSARFEDTVDIAMSIERIGEKSVTFAFTFSVEEKEIGTGKLTAVCCRGTGPGQYVSTPIPPWYRERLEKT
ncbi:MAG TPA: thioesterase family protein [Pirellulales bacterium]|jgi:4-hydroxybenzoyl-CoA thioesterase/acyl-CoA thioester hydrolase|nr:thioesterase family protein [Pirellulales bacterium]